MKLIRCVSSDCYEDQLVHAAFRMNAQNSTDTITMNSTLSGVWVANQYTHVKPFPLAVCRTFKAKMVVVNMTNMRVS